MQCVVCNSKTKNVFRIESYRIVQCLDCTHRMIDADGSPLDIKNIYADKYFSGGTGGYSNYLGEKDILIKHGRRYAKMLTEYFDKAGAVLDIGSAAGFILKGLTDCGWRGEGIEVNDRMADYARKELGLDVHTGTIESFHTEKKYDLICLIQVIAHLINPRKAIELSCNMLSEKGLILVETWNHRSCTARLFGRHWHEYSPPSVLHWFSKESIHRLMDQFGFELIASGHPVKRLSWEHAKGVLISRQNSHSLSQLCKNILSVIPGNISIPYPAEDLLWFLFKKRPHQS